MKFSFHSFLSSFSFSNRESLWKAVLRRLLVPSTSLSSLLHTWNIALFANETSWAGRKCFLLPSCSCSYDFNERIQSRSVSAEFFRKIYKTGIRKVFNRNLHFSLSFKLQLDQNWNSFCAYINISTDPLNNQFYFVLGKLSLKICFWQNRKTLFSIFLFQWFLPSAPLGQRYFPWDLFSLKIFKTF